jgi:phage shock protein PspC (stress-responsive transcriptional regulator)
MKMDKTININLGGILFSIDEEAYHILRDYLQAIDLRFRHTPGGNETIEDIESRIAEIFQSQKGLAGVINRRNVEDMIAIIGKPEDFGQVSEEETKYVYTGAQRKKLYRNTDDRIIGGVCGGFGAYLDTDPVWFRILFAVLALMFGIGFFIYLALWITLPSAVTESQKKEMYFSNQRRLSAIESNNNQQYPYSSRAGNAINEVFRAIGKVLFICLRIFLIIIGVSLVAGGFLALLAFFMVFIFKYPGAFSTNIEGVHLSYLPDFLNYIISPAIVPWTKVLITLTITLPLLAIIYGGIKMIFWFRARDGFVLLGGFILWLLCAAALSIILFNEGISYVETARSTSRDYFKNVPDTLYIVSGTKLSDIKYDNEISVPDEDYEIFISDEKKELYLRTFIDIEPAEENSVSLEINKYSAGRNRNDAIHKAEKLIYNYRISGDSLVIDEFCRIPPERKWSFDEVRLKVFVPEGTIIIMDRVTESLYHSRDEDDFISDPRNRLWFMTGEGLDRIEHRWRTEK